MKNWPRDHKIGFAALCLTFIFGVLGTMVGLFQPEVRKFLGFDGSADNLLSYQNDDKGITLKYPPNWDKQENTNPISQEIVEFISPKESDSDTFQERLVVTIEPADMSLDEYTKLAKGEIPKLNKDANFTKEDNYTLADKGGYMVVYTSSDGKDKLKKMEVWTLKNYQAYSITYIADLDKFDKFLPTAEKIIKSLQIN